MKKSAIYSLLVLSLAFQLVISDISIQDIKDTQQNISFFIKISKNIHHSSTLNIEVLGFHIVSSHFGRSESYIFNNYYELTSFDKNFDLGQILRFDFRGFVYMEDKFDLISPKAPKPVKEVRIVKFIIF